MNNSNNDVPTGAIDTVHKTDDLVRSLRRVTSLEDWPTVQHPIDPVITVAVVDVETDGLNGREDNVTEIAVALIEVDARGRITRVIDKGWARQDPRRPLPPKITSLTGLTNDMLAGKSIKVDELTAFINRADCVLAHNSSFDRKFCERLLPGICDLPWICSMRDVDWLNFGYDGAKLGHLLMQSGLFAPKAHGAADDVEALINLLACHLRNGKTVIEEALANAQKNTVRIDAERMPFEVKDELKRFGYRFDWDRKIWWIEVSEDQAEFEVAWLARQSHQILARETPVTWHDRHR